MNLSDQSTALNAFLGGAASPAPMFLASWEDISPDSGKVKGIGAADGVLAGATQTDLVPETDDDTVVRKITHLSIHNADNAQITLTIQTDDGINERTIYKCTLETLETLTYHANFGWQKHTTAGALVESSAVGGAASLARGFAWIGDANGVAQAVDGGAAGGLFVSDGTDVARVVLSSDATMDGAGAVTIANDAVTEVKTADSAGLSGLHVKKTALVLYDFGADGGAQGAITLASACTIPDNAVCMLVAYEVLTTATSGTDASTIKLNLVTDGDLSTAIAISDAKNPWDAGLFIAAGGGNLGAFETAPTPQKTTGARLMQITVAGGEDLTAGKIVFYVDYWVSS